MEQPGNAGKTESQFIASLKSTEPGPKGDPGKDGLMPDMTNYATKTFVAEEIAKIPAGGTNGPVKWNDVQNKPATFPPSMHSHSEYATKAYVDEMYGLAVRPLGSFAADIAPCMVSEESDMIVAHPARDRFRLKNLQVIVERNGRSLGTIQVGAADDASPNSFDFVFELVENSNFLSQS